MTALVLATVILLGGECVWWGSIPQADEIIVECDLGAGWFACGLTPTHVDSGPFGVSEVRYVPMLRLQVPDVAPSQVFSIRLIAENVYGQSLPSSSVEVQWPEVVGP